MKYIVLEQKFGGMTREYPIIFPEALVHADVAEALIKTMQTTLPKAKVKAVSAGTVNSLDMLDINCHGESTTLGLKSRESQDNNLIKMMDYSHGIV